MKTTPKFQTVFALAVATALVLAAGCAPKQKLLPPAPSTASTAGDIGDAREDAVAAQTNVRAGAVEAKADRGPAAVPYLSRADSQLSDALSHLAAATAHAAELEAGIKASTDAYKSQMADLKSQIAAGAAANKKLSAENGRLKNEVLRQAKLRLGALGALMLLAGVGLVAAAIWGGFTVGFKLAPICASMGAASLALAVMLSKIVLAAEIIIGLCALVALGYAGWRLFSHLPLNVSQQLASLGAEKQSLLNMLGDKPGATTPPPAAPNP